MDFQKASLEAECRLKPKLRTFLKIKDFKSSAAYICKPLSFPQSRMIAKIRLGCLPLRLETGRYSRPRLEEKDRTCLVCRPVEQIIETEDSAKPIESEIHFLFHCNAYKEEREKLFQQMTVPEEFNALRDDERLKIALNEPANVKLVAQFIIKAFNLRSTIVT